MKIERTLEVLNKLKAIHEENPQLAMNDITNNEIVEALNSAADCAKFIIKLAAEFIAEE